MSSQDCHKLIKNYHAKNVTLSFAEQGVMRDRRDTGRSRLITGLENAGYPLPSDKSSQGSYAMRTMVQDDENDYDIDDGVYFEKKDLVHDDGRALNAKEARDRICGALQDGRFAKPAEVKSNCVRQNYYEGFHIDIPVYRICRETNLYGEQVKWFELASGDEWVTSDARKVTSWFNECVGQDLKSGESDTSQLRRVTKLTKKMARRESGWKESTTSGICITRLVVDHFRASTSRDDEALRKTWQAISYHLLITQRISHPVYTNKNLAEESDTAVLFFRTCLNEVLATLTVLDHYDCTEEQACIAWDKVFATEYFSDNCPVNASKSSSLLRAPVVASAGLSFPSQSSGPNKPGGFA